MRELVEFLVESLVDHPDKVEVEERRRADATVLEVRVATEDLGKVIGRQGRTARALRSILSAAASRGRRRYILDIVD